MKNKFLLTAIALCVSVSTFAQLGTGLLEDPTQKSNFSEKEPGTHGYGTTIPSSYSMQMFTPFIKSQGAYGTCAAWSAAYSAYTTQYAKKMGLTDRNLITALAFCPYYVYNKANGDNACEAGTSLETILIFMRDYGVKRFYMPIIGCGTAINTLMDDDASHYAIKDAYYLYDPPGYPSDRSAEAVSYFLLNKPKPDIEKIKGTLADGYPVVFGGYVANSFMNASGSSLWEPTAEERTNPGQAVIDNTGMHQQHAMCIVGYDDNKFGGAFLVMNSWSTLWGDNGYIWIKYDDWALFNYKAFWLDIGQGSLELLVDSGCASGDCNDGYGVYKFSNGQRYEGHFQGGVRNGYGIYTWPDGSAYAGEWVNDKRNGEAVIYLTNGSNGTCTYKDDVQATGFGDWVYNNGDKYTGNLSTNYIRNGYGKYTFADGRKYTGSNVDDKFSGLGKMQWNNGDVYIGEWSDNEMNGNGIYIFSNGKLKAGKWSYGQLKEGKAYGYAQGANKLQAGVGVEFSAINLATADCVSGDCLNGKGRKKYKNGLVYEGEFKDALEDGYGTMIYSDGSKQTGYFQQGKANGLFRVDFTNGDIMLGECVNGQANGYTIYIFASGSMVVEQYKNGQFIREVVPTGDVMGMQMTPDQFGNKPYTEMKTDPTK